MQFKDGFILAMCKDSKILSTKLLLLHAPIILKWLRALFGVHHKWGDGPVYGIETAAIRGLQFSH